MVVSVFGISLKREYIPKRMAWTKKPFALCYSELKKFQNAPSPDFSEVKRVFAEMIYEGENDYGRVSGLLLEIVGNDDFSLYDWLDTVVFPNNTLFYVFEIGQVEKDDLETLHFLLRNRQTYRQAFLEQITTKTMKCKRIIGLLGEDRSPRAVNHTFAFAFPPEKPYSWDHPRALAQVAL
jgi:hypothetical protein